MSTADVVLVVATVLAAVVGSAVGWGLHTWSDKKALQRAKEEAIEAGKRNLALQLFRNRASESLTQNLNEIPAFFHDDTEIMDLYRKVLRQESSDSGRDTSLIILTCLRRAGFDSTSGLELSDVQTFLKYDPSKGG